jgi:hypothetical protein
MNDTLYNWLRKIENERVQFMGVFATYLRDKTISIDERWDAFLEAPIYVKDTSHSYVPNWIKMGWIDYPYARGQIIHTDTFIEEMIDNDLSPDLIEYVKEEILQHNLGCFCYDW